MTQQMASVYYCLQKNLGIYQSSKCMWHVVLALYVISSTCTMFYYCSGVRTNNRTLIYKSVYYKNPHQPVVPGKLLLWP